MRLLGPALLNPGNVGQLIAFTPIAAHAGETRCATATGLRSVPWPSAVRLANPPVLSQMRHQTRLVRKLRIIAERGSVNNNSAGHAVPKRPSERTGPTGPCHEMKGAGRE